MTYLRANRISFVLAVVLAAILAWLMGFRIGANQDDAVRKACAEYGSVEAVSVKGDDAICISVGYSPGDLEAFIKMHPRPLRFRRFDDGRWLFIGAE